MTAEPTPQPFAFLLSIIIHDLLNYTWIHQPALLHTCVFLLVTAEFNYLGAFLDLEKAEGKDEGGRVALTFSGTHVCLVMVS